VAVPPSSSVSPAPPFPPRGPSGRFPRFPGTTKALRLPIALPASLRCLRSAVPQSVLVICSRSGQHLLAAGPDPLFPGGPPGSLLRKRWDLPGSWADPCVLAPLSDPGKTSVPDLLQHFGSADGYLDRAGSFLCRSFRGSITRLARPLSTLRGTSRLATTQDSLPAGGQPLPDGTSTRRVRSRRFRLWLRHTSPFSRLTLPWRNKT